VAVKILRGLFNLNATLTLDLWHYIYIQIFFKAVRAQEPTALTIPRRNHLRARMKGENLLYVQTDFKLNVAVSVLA
jgi:hypothetical protein